MYIHTHTHIYIYIYMLQKITAVRPAKPSPDDDVGVRHGLGTKVPLINPDRPSSILQCHQTLLVFCHHVGMSDQDAAFSYDLCYILTLKHLFKDVRI